MAHIHVMHENPAWTAPLLDRLEARGLPYRDWDLSAGHVDLNAPPPPGIYYNRMSASAHTRGHRHAPEFATAILHWLEAHDRRVINGSRAIQLEVSKVAQYAALEAAGIRTPRTLSALGREATLAAARAFDGAFISKHNRGGKGLGVRLFGHRDELAAWLDSADYEAPVDGVLLLQEYIRAPEPFITRVEFVGGELLYAVRVDTSNGFELCPAEACSTDPAQPMFEILPAFTAPLAGQYATFLRRNRIQVAGIEFIVDAAGTPFTYDINTNTNYNPAAEAEDGRSGMDALAGYLGRELSGRLYAGEVGVAA